MNDTKPKTVNLETILEVYLSYRDHFDEAIKKAITSLKEWEKAIDSNDDNEVLVKKINLECILNECDFLYERQKWYLNMIALDKNYWSQFIEIYNSSFNNLDNEPELLEEVHKIIREKKMLIYDTFGDILQEIGDQMQDHPMKYLTEEFKILLPERYLNLSEDVLPEKLQILNDEVKTLIDDFENAIKDYRILIQSKEEIVTSGIWGDTDETKEFNEKMITNSDECCDLLDQVIEKRRIITNLGEITPTTLKIQFKMLLNRYLMLVNREHQVDTIIAGLSVQRKDTDEMMSDDDEE